jgi:hypothetical protein
LFLFGKSNEKVGYFKTRPKEKKMPTAEEETNHESIHHKDARTKRSR